MAPPTLSASKTQKTLAAATRVYYFPNLTKTEIQFKILCLDFFDFSLHCNIALYVVVLGRRKNQTFFIKNFEKTNFLFDCLTFDYF